MPGRGTDSIHAISNVQGNILVTSNDFSDGTTQGWQMNAGGVSNGRMAVPVHGPWAGGAGDCR